MQAIFTNCKSASGISLGWDTSLVTVHCQHWLDRDTAVRDTTEEANSTDAGEMTWVDN